MTKELIEEITDFIGLYRDPETGIAWVEDGRTGNGHSAHPNIHSSGLVGGMVSKGFWSQQFKTVKSRGFIYNIAVCTVHDPLDELARKHCKCGGNHGW